jgi:hypothetical protein
MHQPAAGRAGTILEYPAAKGRADEHRPSGQPPETPPRRSLPVADLAVLVVSALAYFYFVTAGTWWWQDGPRYFHELLGDAFAAGQLSLTVQPSPELLALPDPRDPDSRANVPFLHDASLYDGKYYVYWGPFPAVIHTLGKIVTGYSLDQDVLQFLLLASAPVPFWWTIHRIRQRYFTNVPRHLVLVLTILFALSAPMMYLAGRPIHYHESIIFGVTMLVLSWPPLLAALSSEKHARKYLVLSGLLLSGAGASRMPVLMYAVAVGAVLAASALLRRDRSLGHEALKLLAFGAPVGVALALLFAYNYARFGLFSEFGVGYQLQGNQGFYEVIQRSGRSVTSLRSIPPLLALYLVSVPAIRDTPPFLRDDVALIPASVESLVSPDPIFVDAPIMSVFLIVPLTLLALCCPILFLMRWRPEIEPILTFMGILFLGAVLTLLLICTTFGISFRYTADFVPALTMVSALVLLLLVGRFNNSENMSQERVGKVVTRYLMAFTILSLVPTVTLGLLFGLAAWALPAPPWG